MAGLDGRTLASLKEHAEAGVVDMDGGLRRAPRVGPAPASALRNAEHRLGFALPDVVRDLYGRIGNGGFGPGYGLVGVDGGARDDLGHDLVEHYLARREPDPDDPGWSWPERLLAVCHWGCGIYSCVDCRSEDAPVVRFDPNGVAEDWSVAFGPERDSFAAWLRAWVAGEELFRPGIAPGMLS